MKTSSSLAMLVGFVMAVTGLIGMASPETYVRLGWFVTEAPGVYLLAMVQFAIGVVLIRAAPSSRTPLPLGALGVVAIAEVALMPFIGHGRAHAIAQWWGSQAPSVLRFWGLIELSIGLLVMFAVAPRRRGLRPAI